MRLDNLVSKALSISRSEAKSFIAKSKISINQKLEKRKNRQVLESDQVTCDGISLRFPKERYLMLNKPQGYICSTVDELLPSAINLLENQPKEGLHFAGRLDADTTGLVLISDDGRWTHRVSAPSRKQGKTYLVDLAEPVSLEQVVKLEQGIMLNDSDIKTRPSIVELVTTKKVKLTLFEGRYHQVKRMFAAIGNHVIGLHRESIGGLELDASLAEGSWRALSEQEVELFN